MANYENVFHNSTFCKSLDESQTFYVDNLGAQLIRRYDDRVVLNVYGNHLVFYNSPEKVTSSDPKCQHFGFHFKDKEDFDYLLRRSREQKLEFLQDLHIHRLGEAEEHRTFFLKDPSGYIVQINYFSNSWYYERLEKTMESVSSVLST